MWEKSSKRGRKRKRRRFEDTRVGHLLKYEAPLEYGLITSVYAKGGVPSHNLIEHVGYASSNPLFKKPKFRKALIEYRKYGLFYGITREDDFEVDMYYFNLRKNTNKRDYKQYLMQ